MSVGSILLRHYKKSNFAYDPDWNAGSSDSDVKEDGSDDYGDFCEEGNPGDNSGGSTGSVMMDDYYEVVENISRHKLDGYTVLARDAGILESKESGLPVELAHDITSRFFYQDSADIGMTGHWLSRKTGLGGSLEVIPVEVWFDNILPFIGRNYRAMSRIARVSRSWLLDMREAVSVQGNSLRGHKFPVTITRLLSSGLPGSRLTSATLSLLCPIHVDHVATLVNLRSLSISGAFFISDAEMSKLSALKKLERLFFDAEYEKNITGTFLSAFEGSTCLRSVGFEDALDLASGAFISASRISSLTTFIVRGCHVVDDILIPVVEKEGLIHLEVSQCSQVTSDLIARAFRNKSLKVLSIPYLTALRDDAFTGMNDEGSCKLKVLEVGRNNALGVETFTRIMDHTSLTVLSLRHSRVTDENLLGIERLVNLKQLDLHGCKKLTDGCTDTLLSHKTLCEVLISGNNRIGPRGFCSLFNMSIDI